MRGRHMIRLTAGMAGIALLAACASNDPVYSSFNSEAGALVDNGTFGNATMNNHLVMTGERQ